MDDSYRYYLKQLDNKQWGIFKKKFVSKNKLSRIIKRRPQITGIGLR